MCVSDEEFEFMLFFHEFLKYMEKNNVSSYKVLQRIYGNDLEEKIRILYKQEIVDFDQINVFLRKTAG
ncbi:hypothetical protein [Amedibacterium intestinale]|uniref:hypothetical protein n=1 Tax=Amedibacterium intestinale TaxID=2583452 RepID=UPI000E4ECC90|nr:hypothetical protein [Amedibacterium intestinale]RHO33813.1 hypothetical protein DW208_02335 [Erysipelotrichaceae bacterium AM17-60]